MKKIIYLLFIFQFLTLKLNAEIVKKIEIIGNKRVTDETVLIYGNIKKDVDYSENDLNNIIKNLYETEFFNDININLSDNILTVKLEEYPIINQLIITGEKSTRYTQQVKKALKLKEKGSYIKSYLKNDIQKIENLYTSLGFNSVKITVKEKIIENDKFDLVLTIDRGKKTKINTINFVGNKKVSSRRLRDVIASEENKFWKVISRNTNFTENLLDLDTRLLTNYYKSIGFYDIKINSKFAKINQSDNADLFFSIEEGNRYTIGKISTNLDSVFDKDIFFPLNKTYNKYIGDYYSPFKIKKILDELDRVISNNNLQFVEHNVQEEIGDKNINIIINVFEGEKKLVERINIFGNSVTNEDVIRSELILDEGDPYSKLKLEKSISEIKDRRIFKRVDYKVSDGSNDNLKIIEINVEEQPTGEITAGAGVGTDGGMFALGVKENNWLGQGKSVGFDVEVDSESISGTLNYVDPNYDFLGNFIKYSISSETNDKPDQGYENSLTSLSIDTSFEQYKDIFLSLGLSASHDDLRTNSAASSSLQKQKGTYSDITGNYGFVFDNRDRAFMPTSGSIISFGQSIPLHADSAALANLLSISKYKSLNENVIGVGKFYFSSINGLGSDDVRLSKRKGLSTKRLRGFEKNRIGPVDSKDHIGGNYSTAVNFEANLPNVLPESTNADISAFLDFGNVWGVDYDSSIDDSNKIRSSTGLIANWMSPIGPMSFVLSQNISKASTDETQSFSFNLGTTF